jgi:hypothetical protein
VKQELPEPMPVPAFTNPGESSWHVRVITEYLDGGHFDLHGCTPQGMAEYVFVYCQGKQITQETIDLALRRNNAMHALSEAASREEAGWDN